jgi:hypothetical protein
MKFLIGIFLVLFAFTSAPAQAAVLGGTKFTKTIFLSGSVLTTSKSAANSGRDYSSPKGFFDGDLMDIPANVVITNVYQIVDVACSGISAFNLGDDDSSTGFVASPTALTSLALVGMHYWAVDYKGAYLKGGDLVANTVGWNSKYYSATGKELKMDITGTANAACRVRVIVDGYAVGVSGL